MINYKLILLFFFFQREESVSFQLYLLMQYQKKNIFVRTVISKHLIHYDNKVALGGKKLTINGRIKTRFDSI